MKHIQAGLCVLAAAMLIFSIILHFQGSGKSVVVSLLAGFIGLLTAGVGFFNKNKAN